MLAGASAGGLNSVMFAAAQSAGQPVASVLSTWEEAGSIDRLMRSPLSGSVPSLLKGDEYFFPRVLSTLVALYEPTAHAGLVADAVSVDLAATVTDAQDESNPLIAQGRAGFHFATTSTADGARIAKSGSPRAEIAASLERLALAARATSSFPGAFEPARILVIDGQQAGAAAGRLVAIRHARLRLTRTQLSQVRSTCRPRSWRTVRR